MARLNKWFYSGIIHINADNSIKEIQTLAKSKWRKRHYVAWLTIRDLDNTGNLKVLTKRVNSYMKIPTGPPKPVCVFNDPCENLLLSIQALSTMIAHLLIREVTDLGWELRVPDTALESRKLRRITA